MARIRIKNGPAKGTAFEIADEPLVVGRDPSCQIQVLDKGASRNHAEVFRIGEMCFIRDLESRNGTFVNDAKIDEELLREGDRIQIGATVLVFDGSEPSRAAGPAQGVEFSEEEEGFANTLELRLEDLTAMNVGDGDGTEGLRLRALYRLGRIIAEESDEEALVNKVLPFVANQIGAESAYLFTREPAKGNIVPIGTFSKSERKGTKVSRTIIRRAIQEKRALLTSDAMQDDRFSSRDSILLKQIHSVICVPLSVTGDLSGVLYLAGDSPNRAFNEDELELAAAMADQIGLAITHLRTRVAQRENLMSTIRVLVRALEMRDPTARGRSERVAAYATAIGRQLRMAPEALEELQLAALLHDLGSLAQNEPLLAAGEAIRGGSPEERCVRLTLEFVREMSTPPAVEEAIRHQLERDDGSGPEGMRRSDIPLGARIIAVASAFDKRANQVTTKSSGVLLKEAIVEMGKMAGRQYDEDVVKALLIAHRNGSLYATLDEQREAERAGEAQKASS